MNIKQELFFPQIHYYDPDFVSIYEQTWFHIENLWVKPHTSNHHLPSGYINYEDNSYVYLLDVITSSFFLLYSNPSLSPIHMLDFFYSHQEESGEIHFAITKDTGEPISIKNNDAKIIPPLILWAEFNYYNRTDNKRRLKDILPKLDAYLDWFVNMYQHENGLFSIPKHAHYMNYLPNKNISYFIDFNSQMALAYYYMINLSSYTNYRNLVFKYTKLYYNLKALINKYFWNAKDAFYYDLDDKLEHITTKSLSSFWTLIAQIPNNNQASSLQKHLRDPQHFNAINAFPSLSQSNPSFSELGHGYNGAVYPLLTYMIVKGLSAYSYHETARESTIKHLSNILTTFYSDDAALQHTFWEAYQPNNYLPAKSLSKANPIRQNYFSSIGLSTIALSIENIIGFDVCLPKKMVFWTIPNLEYMGIESFQLKKNQISTILQNTNRGWEIRHSSEKLYYFSVNIIEKNKQKTLPIPSGKCSLLIDKL